MVDIKVQLSAKVSGGPQASLNEDIKVEAYNKIEVAIQPGDTDKVVNVAQGDKGEISFLLITSNLYSSEEKLTYKVGDKEIQLDQPQIFLGTGAVSLLGENLNQIQFSNKHEKATEEGKPDPNKADIEILVGRDATP
ncbi:hypothetical protein Riv7116_5185 [Rivularia sp. PCC 7116]|uniref:hypothetical protein n=1 Tax=Rivularia sp. PCC 7116 TaxID=373994 RepID=UPI00029EEF11|nr:hypothetical protein [Rivularia sp. PCC 7116]AFY57581.1 hypothetical protein Riv7116_5185 [Rivularia sp. PCC 7116]